MRRLCNNASFRRITAGFLSQALRAHKQAFFEVIQRGLRVQSYFTAKKNQLFWITLKLASQN
jgi:hypothetical protein